MILMIQVAIIMMMEIDFLSKMVSLHQKSNITRLLANLYRIQIMKLSSILGKSYISLNSEEWYQSFLNELNVTLFSLEGFTLFHYR